MAFTTPPFMTNGVDSISASNFNSYIRNNIDFFRERPTVFVKADDNSLTTASEDDLLKPDSVSDPETVWDTDNLHSTLGGVLELDSVAGFWYVGGTVRFDINTTGDRRLNLTRQNDSLDYLRWRVRSCRDDRKVRLSAATVADFTASNDLFDLNVYQTSGGALTASGSLWAMWMSGDSTFLTTAVENLAIDRDTSMTDWFNQWRANVRRLYHRPHARVRLATDYTTLGDGSYTKVPFDTQVNDNANMVGADESVITARYDGYYYASACVAIDGFTGSNDRMIARFEVNGTGIAAFSSNTDVSAGDGTVHVETIVRMESGDELSCDIFKATTGGNSTIQAGTATAMSCELVSGDVVAPGRQFFTDGLPAVTPDFTAQDTGYVPQGLLNLCCRDMFAHLWNPPVISAITSDGDESARGGGWSDVGCDTSRYNNWNLDGVFAGGRLVVPFAGQWLVTAYLDLDDTEVGDVGDRGMRIKHNKKELAPIRTRGANVSSHNWSHTNSCLINADAGDEVGLQALNSTDDEIDVTTGVITMVWMRDKV